MLMNRSFKPFYNIAIPGAVTLVAQAMGLPQTATMGHVRRLGNGLFLPMTTVFPSQVGLSPMHSLPISMM